MPGTNLEGVRLGREGVNWVLTFALPILSFVAGVWLEQQRLADLTTKIAELSTRISDVDHRGSTYAEDRSAIQQSLRALADLQSHQQQQIDSLQQQRNSETTAIARLEAKVDILLGQKGREQALKN